MASLELAPVTGLGATDPVAASAEKAASRLASYGANWALLRGDQRNTISHWATITGVIRRRSTTLSPSLTLSITPPSPPRQRTARCHSTSATAASSRSSTSPRGAEVPAQAVRRPQGGQVRRLRAAAPDGQEHRADLREDVDADPDRVRGGGQGPGRTRDLPGAERVADRPQGVDEGHRARAGPHLRRHRVPRLRPGERRDPGRVRRRAGVERADRRVPPDPDPGRHADDDRAQRQAPARDRLLLPGRRPQQHGQLADGRRLQVRHGRPAVRPAATCGRTTTWSRRAGGSPRRPAPG